MNEVRLLRGDDLVINDKITIKHLTVNQIVDFANLENGEERYFALINLFLLRPYDLMDKLDDIGVDYETMTEYELFISLFRTGQYDNDIKLLIGDYNFKATSRTDTNEVFLYDKDKLVMINEDVYLSIKKYLSKMHYINLPTLPKAGNKAIKKYRIDKKRKERKNQENKEFHSQLFDLVSSIMVGTDGSVTFFNVWDMPIYSAYTALIKTLKLQNYMNTMFGIYTGNISSKDVSKDTLNWTVGI